MGIKIEKKKVYLVAILNGGHTSSTNSSKSSSCILHPPWHIIVRNGILSGTLHELTDFLSEWLKQSIKNREKIKQIDTKHYWA